MSYPSVFLSNHTGYPVTGRVVYRWCRDDDYSVAPKSYWQGPPRGLCLITQVTATVKLPNRNVEAAAFTSGGSGMGNFYVTPTGAPDQFQVTTTPMMAEAPAAVESNPVDVDSTPVESKG